MFHCLPVLHVPAGHGRWLVEYSVTCCRRRNRDSGSAVWLQASHKPPFNYKMRNLSKTQFNRQWFGTTSASE